MLLWFLQETLPRDRETSSAKSEALAGARIPLRRDQNSARGFLPLPAPRKCPKVQAALCKEREQETKLMSWPLESTWAESVKASLRGELYGPRDISQVFSHLGYYARGNQDLQPNTFHVPIDFLRLIESLNASISF